MNDDNESLQPLSFSPQQEMGTSDPQCITLPSELRGFTSSASSCSLPSHHNMQARKRSLPYTQLVQERFCTTATSSPMQIRPNLSSSISCGNCHENQLRASALAIEALYKIAKQSTSRTSIHSDEACDHYSCGHSGTQSLSLRHSASFTVSGGGLVESRSPVLTRGRAYVVSDEESATLFDKKLSEDDGNYS